MDDDIQRLTTTHGTNKYPGRVNMDMVKYESLEKKILTEVMKENLELPYGIPQLQRQNNNKLS